MGVASVAMSAVMAGAAVMPASAQTYSQPIGSGFSGLSNLSSPGLYNGLGNLFLLENLFGGNGGLFGSSGGTTYTVQSGDTLKAIASRFYGNSSLFTVISNANNLANPNVITPGQQLIIPAVNGTTGVNTTGGVLGTGTNNISNLFLYSRLFNGNTPVSLGDLFLMNRLFNNGTMNGISNGGVLSGANNGLSGLGNLFIYDQLFGGYGGGFGANYGQTGGMMPNTNYYPSPNTNPSSGSSGQYQGTSSSSSGY